MPKVRIIKKDGEHEIYWVDDKTFNKEGIKTYQYRNDDITREQKVYYIREDEISADLLAEIRKGKNLLDVDHGYRGTRTDEYSIEAMTKQIRQKYQQLIKELAELNKGPMSHIDTGRPTHDSLMNETSNPESDYNNRKNRWTQEKIELLTLIDNCRNEIATFGNSKQKAEKIKPVGLNEDKGYDGTGFSLGNSYKQMKDFNEYTLKGIESLVKSLEIDTRTDKEIEKELEEKLTQKIKSKYGEESEFLRGKKEIEESVTTPGKDGKTTTITRKKNENESLREWIERLANNGAIDEKYKKLPTNTHQLKAKYAELLSELESSRGTPDNPENPGDPGNPGNPTSTPVKPNHLSQKATFFGINTVVEHDGNKKSYFKLGTPLRKNVSDFHINAANDALKKFEKKYGVNFKEVTHENYKDMADRPDGNTNLVGMRSKPLTRLFQWLTGLNIISSDRKKEVDANILYDFGELTARTSHRGLAETIKVDNEGRIQNEKGETIAILEKDKYGSRYINAKKVKTYNTKLKKSKKAIFKWRRDLYKKKVTQMENETPALKKPDEGR